MENRKNKTAAIAVTALLILSMTASIMLIQTASSHTPPWHIVSYAYLSVSPATIGVGQQASIYMWVDHAIPGADEEPGIGTDVRRANYNLTMTAPDGTVTTKIFQYITDPTGIQSYFFTPDQVGTYSFVFYYPQQTYMWNATAAEQTYTGDVFTASTSNTKTLTVTNDQVPTPASLPLPTSYWTYPVFGENYEWYQVMSNWLGGPYTPAFGEHSGNIQPDGTAPNTSHMLWTRPIQWGGVVGGNDTGISGEAYYQGGSYNIRFSGAIIMNGVLFFQLPYGETGTGGNFVAWDLKTGQQLWSINTTQPNGLNLVPSIGYLPTMDQPNQHGVLPDGLLIAPYSIGGITIPGFGSFGGTPAWAGYDPMTGVLTSMNVTYAPTIGGGMFGGIGSAMKGPNGEYLSLSLVNKGTSAKPNYYLMEWNSSKVFGQYLGVGTSYWYSGTLNANVPITPVKPTTTPPSGQAWNWNGTGWQTVASALAISTTPSYDWNVSVNLTPGTWSIGNGLTDLNNIVLLTQGSLGGHVGGFATSVTSDPANITSVSLNPNSLGTVLFAKSFPPAPGNNSRIISSWDPKNGVFVFWDQESMDHYGYSTTTGNLLWGPVLAPNSPSSDWNYMGDGFTQENIAYGNIYWSGYNGLVYCFNDTTGALKWVFGNGGDHNSTFSPWLPYGYTPLFISVIADGKVYLSSSEHSPNSPLYANYDERAINATTGEELWHMPVFGNLMYGGYTPVASGILVADNTYDQQIDAFGQGPSSLTVTAPETAPTLGSSVVIRGTVTDISAGTRQAEQAANFPNGVPAVSDASMDQWMQYVYMQQPKPTNTTGVPVTISVIDSNGNFRQIGQTTSDDSGMFTFTWKPDISGDYKVIANFAGSGSYYPSSAETSFTVDNAAPTQSPAPVTTLPPTEMYIEAAAAAIIVAIAVVGAVLLMAIRKRP